MSWVIVFASMFRFTGAHKARFDAAGKGLGKQGRTGAYERSSDLASLVSRDGKVRRQQQQQQQPQPVGGPALVRATRSAPACRLARPSPRAARTARVVAAPSVVWKDKDKDKGKDTGIQRATSVPSSRPASAGAAAAGTRPASAQRAPHSSRGARRVSGTLKTSSKQPDERKPSAPAGSKQEPPTGELSDRTRYRQQRRAQQAASLARLTDPTLL